MIKNPLISIITVVYNGSKTLEKTIQSVINQKYDNYEYIIIDGQSTDNTIDIIKQYEEYIAIWVSNKDNGIYDAMNKGLKYAKGKWVYFLGADDLLRTNILLEVSKYLNDEKCIYYGNVKYMKTERVYDGKFTKFKFAVRNICHQSIFYPNEIFCKVKFKMEYKYLADYVLNLTIYKSYKYHYIPLTIADYNDTGSSARNQDLQFITDRFKLLRQAFPFYVYSYAVMRTFLKKMIRNG